jgi:LysR family transcriptional activator of nhaA
MAAPEFAARVRRNFPQSLSGAAFIMPGMTTAVSRSLHEWFESTGIRPRVVAECDDGGLVKELGKAGKGVFALPAIMEAETKRQYGVAVVGRAPEVKQSYYAISVERKIRHPAVAAICDAARNAIFTP